MYRPENPYSRKRIKIFDESRLTCIMEDGTFMDDLLRMEKERAYEEALDAMLEGLKKGIKPTLKPGRIGDSAVGYLVFIPDKQVKKDG